MYVVQEGFLYLIVTRHKLTVHSSSYDRISMSPHSCNASWSLSENHLKETGAEPSFGECLWTLAAEGSFLHRKKPGPVPIKR